MSTDPFAKFTREGYTFDDVLLIPGHSQVLPSDTDITTKLTRNITLNIPIVSSAMDTVTEHRLAIALAREGGIGILHKNQPVDRQVEMVSAVKRSENGMITDPVTIRPDANVGQVWDLMERFRISGIPVTTEDREIVGIVTNRDLRFETDRSRPITDYMTTENLVTAPVGTGLIAAKELLHKHRIEKLLVVDDSGKLAGMITIKDIQKLKEFPRAAKDKQGRLLVGAAVSASDESIERSKALVAAGVDVIVVDTAHGHSQRVLDMVSRFRDMFPDLDIIAGNVVTAQATIDLIKRGVDAVKVGIGGGSICTTRIVAGIGVPQITAVVECASAAAEYNIPIISDGGIKFSGDIVKAIAAGASAVMLGGLLAGTDEAPGETELYEGRSYKTYRAMGSMGAMMAGSDRYFQSSATKLVPEGIEGRITVKGPLSDTIFQLTGGLRAGMGYVGAQNVKELFEKGQFIRITQAGQIESHPHDVTITKEAPNYKRG